MASSQTNLTDNFVWFFEKVFFLSFPSVIIQNHHWSLGDGATRRKEHVPSTPVEPWTGYWDGDAYPLGYLRWKELIQPPVLHIEADHKRGMFYYYLLINWCGIS